MPENLEHILSWASCTTGEGRRFDEGYFWTPPVKTALFRLTQYESYFIGLIGLVGTGKSSAVIALQEKLENTICEKSRAIAQSEVQKEKEKRIAAGQLPPTWTEEMAIRDKYNKKVLTAKWHADLWTMFHNSLIGKSAYLKYRNAVICNLKDAPKARKMINKKEAYIKTHSHQPLTDEEVERRAIEELQVYLTFSEAEKMLPSKVLEQIRIDIILKFLDENIACLLIDMPDYSQKGCWKINKDLDGIGALWNLLKQTSSVSIMVCLQQELVMKEPHLILGKMDKIMLKTLTVEQLLEAYRQFFESYEPFTEEALRLIATLSRGVFRRFKNYVRLCLELASIEGDTTSPITIDLVKRAITKDQLRMDMDLELSEFLKNSEKKLHAFNILDFVRDSPDVSQKVISEALSVHPNAVGDVVKQLCLHNYLQVKRGKGTELLVSLKE